MLTLYLLRHAQSLNNAQISDAKIVGGRATAVPLSGLGVEQARRAGSELARAWQAWKQKTAPVKKTTGNAFGRSLAFFDAIFCSNAVRARLTLANALDAANELGAVALRDVPVVFSEEIEERELGEWVGRPMRDFNTREYAENFIAGGADFAPAGGESQRDVGTRMLNYIKNQILPRHPNGNVLMVSHCNALVCLLCAIFDYSPVLFHQLSPHNASFSKLTFSDNRWTLNYWNQPWLL